MKRLAGIIILLALGFIVYTIFSDPQRRESIFHSIENSTGFNMPKNSNKTLDEANRKLGESAEKILGDIEKMLNNPKLKKSLDTWKKEALKKLDNKDMKKLKRKLKKELDKGTDNLDEVLDEYFSELQDS